MQNSNSLARLVLCYAVCLFFIVYAISDILTIKQQINPPFPDIFSKTEENLEKNEEIKENSSENSSISSQNTPSQSKTEEKKEESKEVSAEAVKGKIVTRYISPYNAPSSYDGVYLKNSTGVKIDIKSLLNKKLNLKIKKNNQPQVLIMHTHTTESFMMNDDDYYTDEYKSRTTDNSKNMVKIGSILENKLNSNGIKTIHDKTKHDYPEYTGSYNRAASTITSYLKKYPSIKIVLDLHRDSVSADNGKAKLVTTVNGKKAAQVMLVMGSQTGSVTGYPNWKENLSLAFKLQQTMEKKYPTLARPLMLASKKYNQSLSTGSLLIEFGTDVNTLEEACYSAELVADSLVSLLNTLK